MSISDALRVCEGSECAALGLKYEKVFLPRILDRYLNRYATYTYSVRM